MPVKKKRTISDYYPYLSDGDQPEELKVSEFLIGDVSASSNKFILVAPSGIRIKSVKIVVDTTIAVDATNYWTAQINNLTRGRDLLASADTMNKVVAITADTPKTLTPDQNLEISTSDVIGVIFSPTILKAEFSLFKTELQFSINLFFL